MFKTTKLYYGLAIVLLATSATSIFGMDSNTDKNCKCSAEEIRNISKEEFIKNFNPCMKSTFGIYWKQEMRRRNEEKLARLKQEGRGSSLYGFMLSTGNMALMITCPFIAQAATQNIQTPENKITANVGANIGCQMLRSFLFESRLQQRSLDQAVRARMIRDLEAELRNNK